MKKLFCLIGMFITFGVCAAQIPDWDWARSATCQTNTGLGEGIAVASDAWGNVFITGSFSDSSISFGNYTLYRSNINGASIFVAKYDSTGNVLWAKNAGGTGGGEAEGIATDALGEVYLTGGFSGSVIFGNDTLNSTNYGHVFVVKYDSSGNALWAKSAGGTLGSAGGYSVTSDPLRSVYITGTFSSPHITFDFVTLTNSGNTDLFIAKYDSSGNVQWAKNAIGSSVDYGFSITSDPLSNLYITGSFLSPSLIFGIDTLINSGNKDMFLTKYDSSGNVIWAKRAGGNAEDDGYSVALNASGVYATGFFNSSPIIFGTDSLISNGNYNTFLSKYDSSGNVLWAKSFTGGFPYTVASDANDNTYITGSMDTSNSSMTFDTVTVQLPTNSFDPMFIVSYNSTGHALWGKALSSGADDNNSVATGTNGSVFIGGDFYYVNPFIVGNDTLIRTGIEDIFVARLSYSSSVGISEVSIDNGFSFYPNPFNDYLKISTNNSKLSEIILYDITSRKILQQEFTTSTTINTSQLAKGIYIYEVRNKNGIIKQGKVVKD